MSTDELRLSSEVVEGALEVIQKYGWRQGAYGDDESGYCVMGAIGRHVFGAQWVEDEAPFPLIPIEEEMVEEYFPYLISAGSGIPDWNDFMVVNQVDVEDKLMEIAKDLRNKGK